VFRGQPLGYRRRVYLRNATVLAATATGVGATVGSALGLAGAHASGATRALALVTLPLLVIALAADAVGISVAIPQRNVETAISSLDESWRLWAVYTGAMLGFGGLTRIGFWIWYLIPVAALASGSLVAGALIWGAYGAVRTVAAVALGYRRFRSPPDFHHQQAWRLLTSRSMARISSDLVGLAAASAVIVAVAS